MPSTLAPVRGGLPSATFRPGTPGFDAAREGFDLSAIPTPELAVSAADEDDVRSCGRATPPSTRCRWPCGRPATVPIGGVDGASVDRHPRPGGRAGRPAAADGDGPGAGVNVGAACWSGCAPVRADPAVRLLAGRRRRGLHPRRRAEPPGTAARLGRGPRPAPPAGRRRRRGARGRRRTPIRSCSGPCAVAAAPSGSSTELEFDLFPGDAALRRRPATSPASAAPEVLAAFGAVTATAPDALSLSVAFVTFPDVDAVPSPGARPVRRPPAGGPPRRRPRRRRRLIAPLRAVAAPLLDTVRPLPIDRVRHDPRRPHRGRMRVSCGGAVLPRWDDAAIAVLLAEIGRDHTRTCWSCGTSAERSPVRPPWPTRSAIATPRSTVFTSAYPGPAFADAAAMQGELLPTAVALERAASRSTTSPPTPKGGRSTLGRPSTRPPWAGSPP